MRLALIMCALLLLAAPSVSGAVESYQTPDVSKAKITLSETQYLKDRTPPAQIEIKTYKGENGWLFRSYSIKGNVFRYDISENGELPYAYRIVDNDGDGVFETKEQLIGEMTVKDKGLKYFVDLGPEPGKEYRFSYEDRKMPTDREQRQMLMGYPVYIPAWVLLRF
jgi:hypothetical protein